MSIGFGMGRGRSNHSEGNRCKLHICIIGAELSKVLLSRANVNNRLPHPLSVRLCVYISLPDDEEYGKVSNVQNGGSTMKYHSEDQIGPGFGLMVTFKFTMADEAIPRMSRIEEV